MGKLVPVTWRLKLDAESLQGVLRDLIIIPKPYMLIDSEPQANFLAIEFISQSALAV